MQNKKNTDLAPVQVGDFTVLSDTPILHRCDAIGIRVARVQRIELRGTITEVRFWNDLSTGRLVRVEALEVK